MVSHHKSFSLPAFLNPSKRKYFFDVLFGKTAGKWHPWLTFLFAFIDSSVFPMPVSTLFVILLAINPDRYKEFIICTLTGIIMGALTAYTTGFFFLKGADGELTVITKYMTGVIPGLTTDKLSVISHAYSMYGILVLTGGAFTFLPYGLFAFFSGISGMNIILFIIGTLTGHGLKIMLLAAGTLKMSKPLAIAFWTLKTVISRLTAK